MTLPQAYYNLLFESHRFLTGFPAFQDTVLALSCQGICAVAINYTPAAIPQSSPLRTLNSGTCLQTC